MGESEERKNDIKPEYYPLYKSKNRYNIITGGRGSGKSHVTADFSLKLTFDKGHGILYTRYTMVSAEKSIIPEFREAIKRNGFEKYFTITKTLITNKLTGSFVLFSGIKTSSGDQTGNLKSIKGITTWIIEEMEDYNDEKSFNTINRSIRIKGKMNRVIMLMNPSYKTHFVYQRFILPELKIVDVHGAKIHMSGSKDVTHIHTTYHAIKEHLNEDILSEAEYLRKNKREEYNKSYLGEWSETKGGLVIEDWDWCDEIPQHLPYVYGMDYGYSKDPLALVKVAYDEKNRLVYVEEHLYEIKLKVHHIMHYIRENLDINDLYICETADPRLTDMLRDEGLNAPKFKKPKILLSLNELIGNKIMVVRGSNNIVKEFSLHEWNERRAGLTDEKNNHCFEGDTLVLTNKGYKKISNIKINDKVKTTNGYNKVLKVWRNGKKQTTQYSLNFGTFSVSLQCTPDHKIKTSEGWKEIQELKEGMTLYLHKNLTEKFTTYTKEKGIFQKEIKGFIGLFGSSTMVKYLKTFIYTTWTAIQQTTIYQILNSWMQKNTCVTKVKGGTRKIKNGVRNFIQKALKLQKNGINQMKGGNGILNMEKIHGKIENTELLNANSVEMNIKQGMEGCQNIAITTVKLKRLEKGEKRTVDVYDLFIENEHEYFANGILVHNCIDAIRYGYNKLSKKNNLFYM